MDDVSEVKKSLKGEFEMKDLGEANRILGMDISRFRKEKKLVLHQKHYIEKITKTFTMQGSKKVSVPIPTSVKLNVEQRPKTREEHSQIPYFSVVGSLVYVMLCTRPDIAHSISDTN